MCKETPDSQTRKFVYDSQKLLQETDGADDPQRERHGDIAVSEPCRFTHDQLTPNQLRPFVRKVQALELFGRVNRRQRHEIKVTLFRSHVQRSELAVT